MGGASRPHGPVLGSSQARCFSAKQAGKPGFSSLLLKLAKGKNHRIGKFEEYSKALTERERENKKYRVGNIVNDIATTIYSARRELD